MIRTVLGLVFPGVEFVIRGGDRSWKYEGEGSKKGKMAHMASASEEIIANNPNLQISKSTTLLIDDDANNIKTALKEGVRAIWLNPRNSHQLIADVQALV